MSAGGAVDAGDLQGDCLVNKFDLARIAAIPDQLSGMSTCTGKGGKIKRKDDMVIKILRNRVAVFCFYCYHKQRTWCEPCCVKRDRNQTLVGEVSVFCYRYSSI